MNKQKTSRAWALGVCAVCLIGIVSAVLVLQIPQVDAAPPAAGASRPQGTIVGGVISSDTTWNLAGSPYTVTSDVKVEPGAILTVEAGVEVRFNNNLSLLVQGGLWAVGTSSQPVTFTSSSATPAAGDWEGIFLESSDDERAWLEHCAVGYGGHGVTGWHGDDWYANLNLWESSPAIQNCTFNHSAHHGLQAAGSQVTIQDSIFAHNGGNGFNDCGLYVDAGSRITATNSTFDNNAHYGLWIRDGGGSLNCSVVAENGVAGIYLSGSNGGFTTLSSAIHGNTTYGLNNATGVVAEARFNWWGDLSGPFHLTRNPIGLGDPVSDNVNFEPWLPQLVCLDDLAILIKPSISRTLVYTDHQGLPTTIEVPTRAVSQNASLAFTPVAAPIHPLPSGVCFAGHAFNLDAYCYSLYHSYFPLIFKGYGAGTQDSAQQSFAAPNLSNWDPEPSRPGICPAALASEPAPCDLSFQKPVTITIHYSDSDVACVLDENYLTLYYWAGSEWKDATSTCTPPSTYTRDLTGNVLSVPICHLTPFAIGGK